MNMSENNKWLTVINSRKFKYGTVAIVAMILTVALFVAVNLGSGLTYAQVDLTPEGLYSISDQTKDVLEELEDEVTIYGLFDETRVSSQDVYMKVMELLKLYEAYDNVNVVYADPAVNMGLINELDPDRILNI